MSKIYYKKVINMDSKKAIWLCDVLKEQENISLSWRVLKKYSDDYDQQVIP